MPRLVPEHQHPSHTARAAQKEGAPQQCLFRDAPAAAFRFGLIHTVQDENDQVPNQQGNEQDTY